MRFLNSHFSVPGISQQATRRWNLRKLSQCYALLTEFSSKTRKCLVRQGTGASGNSLPVSNKALEPAEIPSPRTTEHRNLRKFFPRERRDSDTGGNLFSALDKTLERAEICSPRATIRRNWRKFVHSEQRGVVTGGNLFTACNGTLELVENKREFYEVKLGKQGFALRPRKNSK